jgi:hypothetical protein
MNNDLKTTLAGLGISGMILAQVDLQRLMAGERSQFGIVILSLLVGVLGYFTNKAGSKNG